MPFRERLATASDKHTQLFKQLARSATDHRRRLGIRCIANVYFSVARVDLSARKSVKTAQKREFIATFDPENFRIVRISIVPQKDDSGRVFGRVCYGSFRPLPRPAESLAIAGTPRHAAHVVTAFFPEARLIVFEEAYALYPLR